MSKYEKNEPLQRLNKTQMVNSWKPLNRRVSVPLLLRKATLISLSYKECTLQKILHQFLLFSLLNGRKQGKESDKNPQPTQNQPTHLSKRGTGPPPARTSQSTLRDAARTPPSFKALTLNRYVAPGRRLLTVHSRSGPWYTSETTSSGSVISTLYSETGQPLSDRGTSRKKSYNSLTILGHKPGTVFTSHTREIYTRVERLFIFTHVSVHTHNINGGFPLRQTPCLQYLIHMHDWHFKSKWMQLTSALNIHHVRLSHRGAAAPPRQCSVSLGSDVWCQWAPSYFLSRTQWLSSSSEEEKKLLSFSPPISKVVLCAENHPPREEKRYRKLQEEWD